MPRKKAPVDANKAAMEEDRKGLQFMHDNRELQKTDPVAHFIKFAAMMKEVQNPK